MNRLTIRVMTPGEVEWAVQMAAGEGWNPGLSDAASFCRADPQGFFVGLLDGKPIGCISAVAYAGQFGFIGLYIVVPEERGRGYGLQIWQRAMAHLKSCNIGLDGVPDQVSNYIKSGFKLAYYSCRFEGRFEGKIETSSENIVSLAAVPFDTVRKYDRACFPAPRPAFLQSWLRQPDAFTAGYLDSGILRGYGVLRKCRQGSKFGPLFADSAEIAHKLFLRLTSRLEQNTLFYLDVPEPNLAAIDLVNNYSMKKVFATARMYTGNAPDIALGKVFGATTFELG